MQYKNNIRISELKPGDWARGWGGPETDCLVKFNEVPIRMIVVQNQQGGMHLFSYDEDFSDLQIRDTSEAQMEFEFGKDTPNPFSVKKNGKIWKAEFANGVTSILSYEAFQIYRELLDANARASEAISATINAFTEHKRKLENIKQAAVEWNAAWREVEIHRSDFGTVGVLQLRLTAAERNLAAVLALSEI